MASPILRVDLADGARDYQPTATEPGLPMLDRQHTNYQILHRWLGDLIAEPEWKAAHVEFYLRDDARGRLENVQCAPATREDLEGPLKPQLDEIAARLKKAKPESSTEKLLHRIARQTFQGLSADLSQSDFDSYFFKCRSGREPWRLVWCWGYQRTDQQPAPALICSDPECNQLFVRRPGTKARCPACEALADPRRKKAGAVRGGRTWALAALILLLLLAAFLWFNRPRLVVAPGEWSVPQGSQVDFRVTDARWYFFEDDVTNRVIAQSLDPRVVSFREHGATARAVGQGETTVTFLLGDRAASVPVEVGPPQNPASIAVAPEQVQLSVGGTLALSVNGTYENGQVVELTDSASFTSADTEVAYVYEGRVEGIAPGETTIAVRYQAPASTDYVETLVPVVVSKVVFTALEITLDPARLAANGSGRLTVYGLDSSGERHDLTESSRLRLEVVDAEGAPSSAARVEGEYLVAQSPGSVVLRATLGEELADMLQEELPVEIGPATTLAGELRVLPEELTLSVGETFDLAIRSGGEGPIEASSDAPAVVAAEGEGSLLALAPGTATVLVEQGDATRSVAVTVVEAEYESIRIEPPQVAVRVGDEATLEVFGTTSEGKQVRLDGSGLTWLKQPLTANALFDRSSLSITGLKATEEPQTIAVQYGENLDLIAEASFEVVAAPGMGTLAEGEFLSHPPVGLPGRTVVRAPIDLPGYGGQVFTADHGLYVRDFDDDSLWARAGLLPGSTILGANDVLFSGASDAELREYLRANPIDAGSRLLVRFPDGSERLVELGKVGRLLSDVEVARVTPKNVTLEQFDAELVVGVRQAGEYRVLSREGEPLTEYKSVSADSTTTFEVTELPRSSEGDTYELSIERRIGDTVRQYPFSFALESE